MNSATRVLSQARVTSRVTSLVVPVKLNMLNLTLMLAVLISAFFIIYVKDLNRRLFIQYQTLQTTHDRLYEDWGKLLLEQSTWSTTARVKTIAEQRLNMDVPSPKDVVMIKVLDH